MTVKELIKKLETFDANATVRFAYDCGDYIHTLATPEVQEVTEKYTAYNHNIAGEALCEDAPANRAELSVVLSA